MRPFTIEQAHVEVDRIWGIAIKDTRISCSRGCCACCSEPLVTSIEEAELEVSKIPPAELEGVKERTKEWLERFSATDLINQSAPKAVPYQAARLPCPLLKNRECLVYADRPIGCRTYCAVGPAEKCETDRAHQIYALSEEMAVLSSAILYSDGQYGDHLGILLHRLLFGSNAKSAAIQAVAKTKRQVQGASYKIE